MFFVKQFSKCAAVHVNDASVSFNHSYRLQTIKDRQLFAINGAMVLVVFFVLVLWEILSPHQVVVHVLEKQVDPTEIHV